MTLSSPMLFSVNGYQLVVMPMLNTESQSKGEPKAEAEPETTEPEATETVEPEPEVEVTEPVAEKPKGKRNRAKQPVTA